MGKTIIPNRTSPKKPDPIWIEKIRRARAMTGEERMAEGFRLSNLAMQKMLAESMQTLGTDDEEEGWKDVERRIDEQDLIEDSKFYWPRPLPKKKITSE